MKKFTSSEEMLTYITKTGDLYNPKAELYVFCYSERNAICTYSITNKEAISLSKENDYWSAWLGHGGTIYDTPKNLNWCQEYYMLDGWFDTKSYREAVEK